MNSLKLEHLFAQNRAWSQMRTQQDADFFRTLARQQAPDYLWIGCADSRVSANEIMGLLPGEIFVHRNVANLVAESDLNCLSVIQFAVDILKVEHIIVCGHYGCGGVQAVIEKKELGLVNTWLRPLAGIQEKFSAALSPLPTNEARAKKLCELNITEQVRHVSQTPTVQNAWKKGQPLAIHGWVYGLEDGLLRDLLKNPVTSSTDRCRPLR